MRARTEELEAGFAQQRERTERLETECESLRSLAPRPATDHVMESSSPPKPWYSLRNTKERDAYNMREAKRR